jgi:hypothetical protein
MENCCYLLKCVTIMEDEYAKIYKTDFYKCYSHYILLIITNGFELLVIPII